MNIDPEIAEAVFGKDGIYEGIIEAENMSKKSSPSSSSGSSGDSIFTLGSWVKILLFLGAMGLLMYAKNFIQVLIAYLK